MKESGRIERIQERERELYWPVFSRYPVCFTHGDGVYLYDTEGKEYLDFLTGVGVIPLGHANREIAEEAYIQLKTLTSCSNLFYTLPQLELAERLNSFIDARGKWFFSNSGAEAVEALLKIARRYGSVTGRNQIAYLKDSFHGRTFGAMSATGQEKIRNNFGELLSGFVEIDPSNNESIEDCLSKSTAAIIVEIIQGESGVRIIKSDFLEKAYELCRKNGILFLIDEVQTGLGRTGKTFFAHQKLGIEPDGIALAKGLANGIPIGAAWIREELAPLLHQGDHGSTYGGNAFASQVAVKVLQIIERDGLVEKNFKNGAYFMHKLQNMLHNIHNVKEVRGQGLMVAVELENADPNDVIGKLLERGLICGKGGSSSLRFLPPFVVEEKHIDDAVLILKETLEELQ
jgi:predicted acetylornithine/succinylornithine family transaminase